MKKMKQFEDATLDLVLFGFDVLTTSGEQTGVIGEETYLGDQKSDHNNSDWGSVPTVNIP